MAELDVRTPDSKKKADDQYAPATGSDAARKLREQETGDQPGYDREDSHSNTTAAGASENPGGSTSSDNTQNIDSTKQKEEAPWKNFYVNQHGKKEKVTLKNFFKKKGPASLIIGLILGGGGIVSFFSPSLLVIDLKEKMVNAFNDQLAVMDVRSTAMLKKKFGNTVSGVCTSKITIRCKFNTMSDGQIKRMEETKVLKVNKSKSIIPGRYKVESIEYTDTVSGKITKVDARNFAGSLQADAGFRGAMIQGSYSPKLAGFADNTFIKKIAQKVGIVKTKNVKGVTEEELRQSIAEAASGEQFAEIKSKVSSTQEPCDGGDGCVDGKKTVYKDLATGQEITQAAYDEQIAKEGALTKELELRKAAAETGKTTGKATLKGALTSTALGLGAVDSACTGYTVIRAVSFAAKYLGALQLLRYAHAFMNTADSAKALEAEPEQMAYVGKILTTPNSEGKSATDSYGYRYAAYGDSGGMPRSDNLTPEGIDENRNNIQLTEEDKQKVAVNDETTRYINGQLVSGSIMAGILTMLGKASTPEADDFCHFVKGGWGQTIVIGTALVGAVAAFFSGGATLTWGVGAQIAVSVAFSVALAMLTPKLIDMAAGTMITGDENGNEAGNAITSGMGAYNHETSMGRGIPALEEEDAVAYAELTEKTLAQYSEVDRATHSPLDASNPNTFMGSLVSRIVPYTANFSSVSSGVSSIAQFTASSFASLLPNARAQDKSAQFKVCTDPEYKQLKLAADPFCNLKHGLKGETLNIDMNVVIDYMVNNNYVDEETGAPKDSKNDYAKYIKNCMDRAVSIGGYTEDDDNTGEECIQGSADGQEEYKRNMFRLFYIDMSIDDGMENGMATAAGEAAATDTGKVVSPLVGTPIISSGYGPRPPVGGAANGSTWHEGLDLNANPTDVVASMAGEVVAIIDPGSYNMVVIKHADGLKTQYLHMWPQDVTVKVGDKVTAGQKIGKIGCAGQAQGYCGGPHLHFNVLVDEVTDKAKYAKYKLASGQAPGYAAGKAINPANFLKDNGVTGYDGAVNEN